MLSDSHFRSVIDSSKSKIVFHVIMFHPFSYLLLVCIFSIATHSIFICGFKIYVLVHKKKVSVQELNQNYIRAIFLSEVSFFNQMEG